MLIVLNMHYDASLKFYSDSLCDLVLNIKPELNLTVSVPLSLQDLRFNAPTPFVSPRTACDFTPPFHSF